jgi:hypothetical protein
MKDIYRFSQLSELMHRLRYSGFKPGELTPLDVVKNRWWLEREDLVLGQEYPFPNEEEVTQGHIDLMMKAIKQHAKDGVYRRGFHAKGHTCIRGTLEVLESLPEAFRVGLFENPQAYEVKARFSSGSGMVQKDAIHDPRGFGVKVLNVPGVKLVPDRENSTTHDFMALDFPVFPVRNIKEFLEFHKAQLAGSFQFSLYGFRNPRIAGLLRKFLKNDTPSPLNLTYWSCGVYKLGTRAAKFRFRPCAPFPCAQPEHPEQDFLANAVIAHLCEDAVSFWMEYQLQEDPQNHPVEDPSIHWDTPYTPVAKLTFPVQDARKDEACEKLALNPFNVLEAHRPLGNMNRVRKAVYEAGIRLRHEHNGVKRED